MSSRTIRTSLRVLIVLVAALAGCTKPAATSPKAGSGSDDDGFCADLHQNCGPSSNEVSCCGDLICRQRSDETGDVLLHQCLDPNTPPEE